MKQLLTLLLTLALCAGQLCCAFGQTPASQAGPEAAENPCLLSYYDITATLALWEGCKVLALSGLDKPGLQDQWGDAPERLRQTAQAGGDCLAVKLPDGSIATVSLTRVSVPYISPFPLQMETTEIETLENMRTLFGFDQEIAEYKPENISQFEHAQTKWTAYTLREESGDSKTSLYQHFIQTLFCQTILTVEAIQSRPFTDAQLEQLRQIVESISFSFPASGTRTFTFPEIGITISLPLDYVVITTSENGSTKEEIDVIQRMKNNDVCLYALSSPEDNTFLILEYSTSSLYNGKNNLAWDSPLLRQTLSDMENTRSTEYDRFLQFKHPQTSFLKTIWFDTDYFKDLDPLESGPIIRYWSIFDEKGILITAAAYDAERFSITETTTDKFVNSIYFVNLPEQLAADQNTEQIIVTVIVIGILVLSLFAMIYFTRKNHKKQTDQKA